MTCTHCGADSLVTKGSFTRKCGGGTKVRRFLCRRCGRHFSEQTNSVFYRQHRPELEKPIYALLASGVSQRRAARLLQTTRKTIARKLVRLSLMAREHHNRQLACRQGPVSVV